MGDGNQTTYRLGRISWKKLGISANEKRSRILKENYRNPLAGHFLGVDLPPLLPSEIGLLYRKNPRDGLIEGP